MRKKGQVLCNTHKYRVSKGTRILRRVWSIHGWSMMSLVDNGEPKVINMSLNAGRVTSMRLGIHDNVCSSLFTQYCITSTTHEVISQHQPFAAGTVQML